MTYWLNLFTVKTWRESLAHGMSVSGFSMNRWKSVQSMKPGDRLLCYVAGISRFIGVLEVTGKAYEDTTPIWKDSPYPARIPVRPIVYVDFESAVPVQTLRTQLTVFKNLKNEMLWSGPFRGSPVKWKNEDGEVILSALGEAKQRPITRPIDKSKLIDLPPPKVTVTEPDERKAKETEHTQAQILLAEVGSHLGFDVWVPKADRRKTFGGRNVETIVKLRSALTRQFDPKTNSIIEAIDVLWLKQNSIVAAFELEFSTEIYSGLLRMADLAASQPNLSIALFLVAPEDRRPAVLAQIRRPTFRYLTTPLHQVCRYLSFESLKTTIDKAREVNLLSHLRPEFLQEISEEVPVEEDAA